MIRLAGATGPDQLYEMSNMIPGDKPTQRTAPGRRRTRPRPKKVILLIIEVAAVMGLLAGAVHMWNARQELQEDLSVAKEVEATIQAGEQTSDHGAQTEDIQDAQAAPAAASSDDVDTRAPLPESSDNGESSELLPSSLWDVAQEGRR